jgi:DNA (cytosine-5)-methyltransferase 1
MAKGLMTDGQDESAGYPHLICMAHGQARAGIAINRSTTLTCLHEAPIVLMDQGGSVMNTLTDGTVGTLRREMHGHEPCVLAFAQNQLGEVRTGEVFNTINTNSNASGRNTPMVAFPANMSATQYASTEGVACNLQARNPTAVAMVNMQGSKGNAVTQEDGPSFTLNAMHGHDVHAVMQSMQVRRLTPIECERLQGFPDGYTQVPHRGKPAADGPRYKSLGNSMAVPVMRWIGERIQMVESISKEVTNV